MSEIEKEDHPFLSENLTQPGEKVNHTPNKPLTNVSFRLLCDVHLAGGVIGKSGSIVKKIETLTGTNIYFENPLRHCFERVINIVGNPQIDKHMSIGGKCEEAMVCLSQAQEGLVRVLDRILEVKREVQEDHGGEIVRLLAPKSRIGAVMGKVGEVVDAIRRSSGAGIHVLTNEQTPACAGSDEELIQITGTLVAVKKALLEVTRCLQDRAVKEVDSTPVSLSFPRSAVEHDSACQKMANLDVHGLKRKVVFRLLCSNRMAGCVIGKGAYVVRSLENETGSSIKFTPPVPESKECIAIISSWEKADPLYSSAQIAVVRVFSRCMEIELDHGESVIARILVTPIEVDCLMDLSGNVASDISSTSGVDIQLMGGDRLSFQDDADDIVLQITGGYKMVESALFQVTGRLRKNFFFGTVPHGAYHSYDSYTAIPNRLRPTDNAQRWKTCQHQHNNQSKAGFEAPKQSVKVVVPGEAFGSIYGENGSNLARLKEISGATIEFEDPSPDESSGKVIISGTPERIQIAQSLLQAFIIF